MKLFFISIIVCSLAFKYSYGQREFNFKVDETQFTITEENLNTLYGNAFDSMIRKGWTEAKYFELWTRGFNSWKDHVFLGTMNYTTYGNRIGNSSFRGPGMPNEYLGWEKPGKAGTGNPNKEKNMAARMGMLGSELGNQLIYFFTRKVIVN